VETAEKPDQKQNWNWYPKQPQQQIASHVRALLLAMTWSKRTSGLWVSFHGTSSHQRNNAEWRTFLKLRDRVADGGWLRGYAGPPFPYSQDPAVVGLTIGSAARHSNRRIESRRRRSFRRLDSSAPSSRGRRPIAHGLQIVRAQPTAMARAVGHDRIIFAGLPPSVRTQRYCKTPRTPTIFGTSMPNMRCSARRCRLIKAWRLICRLFCGCLGCRWWSSSC
jgi:hypothetical protein